VFAGALAPSVDGAVGGLGDSAATGADRAVGASMTLVGGSGTVSTGTDGAIGALTVSTSVVGALGDSATGATNGDFATCANGTTRGTTGTALVGGAGLGARGCTGLVGTASLSAPRALVVRSVVGICCGVLATGRGLSAFGSVERLGVLGSVGGTALVVGDLVGNATLCKLFDDDVVDKVVVLGAAETASSWSKDICSKACLACHDMGNNGPSPTLFGTTHIPCVATV
jgi:hypothetical protein